MLCKVRESQGKMTWKSQGKSGNLVMTSSWEPCNNDVQFRLKSIPIQFQFRPGLFNSVPIQFLPMILDLNSTPIPITQTLKNAKIRFQFQFRNWNCTSLQPNYLTITRVPCSTGMAYISPLVENIADLSSRWAWVYQIIIALSFPGNVA